MTKSYKYKVSVIMPLYNVEGYLREAVDSIVEQSLGFEDNIQLILVNDGSLDNVEAVCREYKERYPDNVIYVEQQNAGVSASRNRGLEFACGKYINFFDGDDRWAPDALYRLYDYIEKNQAEIDMVAGRTCFFGRQEGFTHPLDFKFDETHIVNIETQCDHVHLFVITMLIKAEVLKNRAFDTRLKYSEDSKLIFDILLDKMAYGVVREAVYYYRKREGLTSAIDNSPKSRSWYFDTPIYCYRSIFDESIRRKGEIIPYAQNLVMYDLQWRMKTQMPESFTEEERCEYSHIIKGLLKDISDEIIAAQNSITLSHIMFALSFKYGEEVIEPLSHIDIKHRKVLNITNMKIRGGKLFAEGFCKANALDKNLRLKVLTSKGESVPVEYYPSPYEDVYSFMGEKLYSGEAFRFCVSLKDLEYVQFLIEDGSGKVYIPKPSYISHGKIGGNRVNAYYSHGEYMLMSSGEKLIIKKRTWWRAAAAEMAYIKGTLLPRRRFKTAIIRMAAIAGKAILRKPIWIVSDRTDMAGDNGEALFEYMMGRSKLPAKVYFAISRDSVDYQRMKRKGKVLKLNSRLYKLYFLMAEKIISSSGSDWTLNAFGKGRNYVKDLYDFDFVFLQHGIIKDDLSAWLRRQKKNISMFVTSTQPEYDSIINGSYDYIDKEVALTGLPRYDKLTNDPEKLVVIAPTWREYLSKEKIEKQSTRAYSPEFKKSEYFRHYSSLISDERLIAALKEHGYRAEFHIHPAFSAQARDFTGNDVVRVHRGKTEYAELFKKGALLVTDYSSVTFDFAYLKKPVVYCQYDRDTFFKNHTYTEGYYDYERDGFGPVSYDLSGAIDEIIKSVEAGCVMEEKYAQRVERFFKWTDKNNCERVYEGILTL